MNEARNEREAANLYREVQPIRPQLPLVVSIGIEPFYGDTLEELNERLRGTGYRVEAVQEESPLSVSGAGAS